MSPSKIWNVSTNLLFLSISQDLSSTKEYLTTNNNHNRNYRTAHRNIMVDLIKASSNIPYVGAKKKHLWATVEKNYFCQILMVIFQFQVHDPKEVEAFKATILKAFDVNASTCPKNADANKQTMTIVKRQNNRRILNLYLFVKQVISKYIFLFSRSKYKTLREDLRNIDIQK